MVVHLHFAMTLSGTNCSETNKHNFDQSMRPIIEERNLRQTWTLEGSLLLAWIRLCRAQISVKRYGRCPAQQTIETHPA